MISLYIENNDDIFDDKLNYSYKNYDIYTYSNGIFAKPNKKLTYVLDNITINHIDKYLIKF